MSRQFPSRRAAALAPLAGLLLGTAPLAARQTPPPPPPVPPAPVSVAGAPAGVVELTRGPVHEAFGRPILFDPRPGPVVPEPAPSPVDEVPPGERPVGDRVAWIPGYWAWDDGSRQYLWVSGFWRQLPPGRVWVPGYWRAVAPGAQWVSGYWAAAGQTEIDYLPEPPPSLEAGPTGPPTAADQIWVPGLWVWQETRYAWRPGFWATASPDWVWVPAHYVWSPLGYALVDGYWDYTLRRRGVLFSPVGFSGVRPGLTFTPRLAVNTEFLTYDLFVRPLTGWYYFGDYYAAADLRAGYYPWFAFHNTRLGYDPLLAHYEWAYGRRNVDWEARLREVYYERRDRPAARPARTYAEFARVGADLTTAAVRPLPDLAAMRDFPFRMDRLTVNEGREIERQIAKAREFADRRAKAEEEQARGLRRGTLNEVRTPVRFHLPEATGLVAEMRGRPTGLPELPRVPVVDPRAQPAPREPLPAERGTTAPRDSTRPQLPLPEDVLRPDFRRAAPLPAGSRNPAPPPPQGSRPPE